MPRIGQDRSFTIRQAGHCHCITTERAGVVTYGQLTLVNEAQGELCPIQYYLQQRNGGRLARLSAIWLYPRMLARIGMVDGEFG